MKKKIEEKALKIISRMALGTARKEVNSACMFLGYQPKIPESALKLRQNLNITEEKSN